MTTKSVLIGATAIAIALTGFDLRPAAAAPQGGPAIVKQNAGADEVSAQRKRRRGVNPALPLAAFGAIIGTIGAVAAENNRRAYYDSYYHAPQTYYEPAPVYGQGYYGPPAHYYAQPQYRYAPPRAYDLPPGHGGRNDYYSRWGGSGGQPGYRGPNVNVPGPTNYGNAAGQNGQMPPTTPMAPVSGGHL